VDRSVTTAEEPCTAFLVKRQLDTPTSNPKSLHARRSQSEQRLTAARNWPGFREHVQPEMPETGRTVTDMDEPLSRFNVTVTAGCDGGYRPGPAAFAAAASRAAWSRPASIISAHLADKIISVVTVSAPGRYAAVAVARAVVADALQRQAMSSRQSAGDRAHHRAEANRTACATLPLPADQALCGCGQQVSAKGNPDGLLNLSCLLPARTVCALAVNRTLGMPVSEELLNKPRRALPLKRNVPPRKGRGGSGAGDTAAWPWPAAPLRPPYSGGLAAALSSGQPARGCHRRQGIGRSAAAATGQLGRRRPCRG